MMADHDGHCEICSVCEREIKENTASIACALCLSWCHKGCTDLKRSEFNKHSADWKKNHKHSWACEDCKVRKSTVGAPKRFSNVNSSSSCSKTSTTDSKHGIPTQRSMRNHSHDGTTNVQDQNSSYNVIDADNLTSNITTILSKNQNQLTLKDAIAAISQLHQVIVEQGNTMLNLLNEIKALKNKTDDNRIQALELETQNLRDELTSIKEANTQQTLRPADIGRVDVINDSVREINDRQQRQKNLMIFGVPESIPTPELTRAQLDNLTVTDIIKTAYPNSPTHDIRVIRVGRNNPDKPRPLKVIMKSASDVSTIIRHAKEIKKSEDYKLISINFDRTPKQIAEYRDLKATLRTRQKNGENDIKIKYLNGCPKIIKVKSNEEN